MKVRLSDGAQSFLVGCLAAAAGLLSFATMEPRVFRLSESAPAGAALSSEPTLLGSLAPALGLRARVIAYNGADPQTVGALAPAPDDDQEARLASSDDAFEGDEFLLTDETESFDVAANDVKGLKTQKKRGGLTILQIGDSHTAADYFTGEMRRLVQKRFGNGGPGYLDAGRPHPGVRSAAMTIAASPGWTYSALQKSEHADRFHLSGFDAETSHAGETLTFSSSNAVPYDRIEIEAVTGPGHGEIEVAVDALPPARYSLAGPERGRAVFRLAPQARAGSLRKLLIKSLDQRPVAIASVGVFNRNRGASYSSVGFPGATIDIVNKYDPAMLDETLKRLAPQIVVLAFGTNEGFNDNLDLSRYREHYLAVINKIRQGAPGARIVMVGPPRANRTTSACAKNPAACRAADAKPYASAATTEHAASATESGAMNAPADVAPAHAQACPFPTPPQLDPVRVTQKEIAKEEKIAFWDWAAIMPEKCGAHAWVKSSPRLMTADHVHFTSDGYKLSAKAFLGFLSPIINQLRYRKYAFSNN